MAEALAAAEAARAEAIELRRRVEEREHKVRQRERDAERRARQQARDLLLQAREQVEAAIREVREAASASPEELEEAARRARRRVEEAARRQAERTPEAEVVGKAVGQTEPPAVGRRVRIVATGATGRVVELRDGRATVDTGGLRLQVPASGLEVLPEEPEQEKPKPRSGAWSAPEVQASPEVDLRGLRVEEVEGRLISALDAAILADLPWIRIIHGKGTGAVRERVAELLREYPQVKSYRLGEPREGGSGVTIAELG